MSCTYTTQHVSLAQYVVPSGGCGNFLCCGKAIYLRSSIRMVSMVKSRFHWARQGTLVGSTLKAVSLCFLPEDYCVYLSVSLVDAWEIYL